MKQCMMCGEELYDFTFCMKCGEPNEDAQKELRRVHDKDNSNDEERVEEDV